MINTQFTETKRFEKITEIGSVKSQFSTIMKSEEDPAVTALLTSLSVCTVMFNLLVLSVFLSDQFVRGTKELLLINLHFAGVFSGLDAIWNALSTATGFRQIVMNQNDLSRQLCLLQLVFYHQVMVNFTPFAVLTISLDTYLRVGRFKTYVKGLQRTFVKVLLLTAPWLGALLVFGVVIYLLTKFNSYNFVGIAGRCYSPFISEASMLLVEGVIKMALFATIFIVTVWLRRLELGEILMIRTSQRQKKQRRRKKPRFSLLSFCCFGNRPNFHHGSPEKDHQEMQIIASKKRFKRLGKEERMLIREKKRRNYEKGKLVQDLKLNESGLGKNSCASNTRFQEINEKTTAPRVQKCGSVGIMWADPIATEGMKLTEVPCDKSDWNFLKPALKICHQESSHSAHSENPCDANGQRKLSKFFKKTVRLPNVHESHCSVMIPYEYEKIIHMSRKAERAVQTSNQQTSTESLKSIRRRKTKTREASSKPKRAGGVDKRSSGQTKSRTPVPNPLRLTYALVISTLLFWSPQVVYKLGRACCLTFYSSQTIGLCAVFPSSVESLTLWFVYASYVANPILCLFLHRRALLVVTDWKLNLCGKIPSRSVVDTRSDTRPGGLKHEAI